MDTKKGKLIILEAGDASGKETQTRLLYERLMSEGRDVTRVSFPDYDSDSSALVRMYLRGDFGAQAADVDAYAASAYEMGRNVPKGRSDPIRPLYDFESRASGGKAC